MKTHQHIHRTKGQRNFLQFVFVRMQICRVKRALCLAAALLGLVTVGQAQTNGTVVAWGSQTTIPVGLSNVVAIAAKLSFNLALRSDGTVVAWGDNTFDQTNVPASVSTVVAIDRKSTRLNSSHRCIS